MIEDDPELCASWRELFEFLGHRVDCYERGLDVIADEAAVRAADVVISDYYLPDVNGAELVKRLREVRAELPAIILTGSKGATVQGAVRRLPRCRLVHKPVSIEVLTREIEEIAGAGGASSG